MIVSFENMCVVGCRKAVGKDGIERTYGNLYDMVTCEMYPFTADFEVKDCLKPISGKLEIRWGAGKNGQWVGAKLLK